LATAAKTNEKANPPNKLIAKTNKASSNLQKQNQIQSCKTMHDDAMNYDARTNLRKHNQRHESEVTIA